MHLLAFAVFLVCAYATRGFIIPSPGSSPYQNIISQTQYSKRDDNSTVAQQRADAVKEAFEFAWDGYFSNCKGQDELLPVTDTCGNPRDHWGASAVDALSTAIVMEIQPIVSDIVLYITTIDFTTSETEVSLFETTIRYLAGMLAGYDLLKGPLSNLTTNASAVDALLTQSKSLADTLSYAFNTTTGIPFNNLFLTNHTTDGSTTNTLATIGSLVLEWQHLSDLTGNTTYGTLAQKAESYLLSPQPTYSVPFPGLLGSTVAVSNGSFLDATGGWNGGDDSFYEYLLKMYVYDSSRYGNYRDHWTSAADSTMKYLAFNPVSRPDLTFLASYVNTSFVNASEHLTCFDGGNFLLGGQVLGRQDYIDFGLKLVDGCHDTYTSTATGIGPEQFSWNTTGVNSKNQAFYQQNGFILPTHSTISGRRLSRVSITRIESRAMPNTKIGPGMPSWLSTLLVAPGPVSRLFPMSIQRAGAHSIMSRRAFCSPRL